MIAKKLYLLTFLSFLWSLCFLCSIYYFLIPSNNTCTAQSLSTNIIETQIPERAESVEETYISEQSEPEQPEPNQMPTHSVNQMPTHSVNQMLPHSVNQMLPHSVNQMLPHSVNQMLPHSVNQMLPHSVNQMPMHSVNQMPMHSVNQMPMHSVNQMPMHSVNQMPMHSVNQMPMHSVKQPKLPEEKIDSNKRMEEFINGNGVPEKEIYKPYKHLRERIKWSYLDFNKNEENLSSSEVKMDNHTFYFNIKDSSSKDNNTNVSKDNNTNVSKLHLFLVKIDSEEYCTDEDLLEKFKDKDKSSFIRIILTSPEKYRDLNSYISRNYINRIVKINDAYENTSVNSEFILTSIYANADIFLFSSSFFSYGQIDKENFCKKLFNYLEIENDNSYSFSDKISLPITSLEECLITYKTIIRSVFFLQGNKEFSHSTLSRRRSTINKYREETLNTQKYFEEEYGYNLSCLESLMDNILIHSEDENNKTNYLGSNQILCSNKILGLLHIYNYLHITLLSNKQNLSKTFLEDFNKEINEYLKDLCNKNLNHNVINDTYNRFKRTNNNINYNSESLQTTFARSKQDRKSVV